MIKKSHVVALGRTRLRGRDTRLACASRRRMRLCSPGAAAFTDYRKEAPGVIRKITVADLPQPYATKGVGNGAENRTAARRYVAARAGRVQDRLVCDGLRESARIADGS